MNARVTINKRRFDQTSLNLNESINRITLPAFPGIIEEPEPMKAACAHTDPALLTLPAKLPTAPPVSSPCRYAEWDEDLLREELMADAPSIGGPCLPPSPKDVECKGGRPQTTHVLRQRVLALSGWPMPSRAVAVLLGYEWDKTNTLLLSMRRSGDLRDAGKDAKRRNLFAPVQP